MQYSLLILFIFLTQSIALVSENFELFPSPPIKQVTIFLFDRFLNLKISSLDGFLLLTNVPVILIILLEFEILKVS